MCTGKILSHLGKNTCTVMKLIPKILLDIQMGTVVIGKLLWYLLTRYCIIAV